MTKPTADRYAHIIRIIGETKPMKIVEVGVWNGHRATRMAAEALKYKARVHYTGFDLFELANDETNRDELNAKTPNAEKTVRHRLNEFQKTHPGFSFELVKGNTRETLKSRKADFAYIDGGHSVETIRSDYDALKETPVIVFDDYYLPDGAGKNTDLDKFGANRVVDDLNPEIINTQDPLIGGGHVCLAVVRKRELPEVPSDPIATLAAGASGYLVKDWEEHKPKLESKRASDPTRYSGP